MQGILFMVLVAACIESSTARPRVKSVAVMSGDMWDRPDPPASQPYPLVVTNAKGMNPHLDVSVLTKESRLFIPNNNKIKVQTKSKRPVERSWVTYKKQLRNSHQKARHRLPINSREVLNKLLNITKKRNVLIRRRDSSRHKRSVVQGTSVRKIGSKNVKFRKQGSLPLYLMPSPSGNTIMLGAQHMNHSCFQVHMFAETRPNQEGHLVMLQAHTGGYLHSNSSGFLSLVNSEQGAATVSQLDNRFFRLASQVSETVMTIKHIITNLHVQATESEVSLVSSDPIRSEGMHFSEYSCSAT